MKKFAFTSLNSILQNKDTVTEPLYIGDMLPNHQFHNIINYPLSSATLAQLQANHTKLALFCFWFTSCIGCGLQFKGLELLQKKFYKHLQIILVTGEPDDIVYSFITQWELENQKKFELPVITSDTTLHQSFRQLYNPHFVWVAPDNVILAQTSSLFVSETTLGAYLIDVTKTVCS